MRYLPPFLLPHKHYMTGTIVQVTAEVLTRSRELYRSAVLCRPPRRQSFVYEDGTGKRMSHVTCWRWIGWMAQCMMRVLAIHPRAGTADPAQELQDSSFRFSQKQARSKERMDELYLARRFHMEGWMKKPPDHRLWNRTF